LQKIFAGGISRKEIWLQSKFTSVDGQDSRLPYDPNASLTDQVNQSFASSLKHLHTDYLNSYLLHGPYGHPGLGAEDFEVWAALEKLYESGAAKSIGISNVNLLQMQILMKESRIKPMMVQNRCYASRGWDKDVREFCQKNNIHYQGFSLLTANSEIVQNSKIFNLAKKYQTNPEQIIFRFASQIGMIPLTGTSDEEHMKLDLGIFDFTMLDEEIEIIRGDW
jgi:diketogulonate reductase-like aldo/keto reductase